MSQEFTIIKGEPPAPDKARKPKCALRVQIEGLKVGEVLQWRPVEDLLPRAAYRMARSVRKSRGFSLEVRKVNLGYDIYRTA